jgi:hypothetical protein
LNQPLKVLIQGLENLNQVLKTLNQYLRLNARLNAGLASSKKVNYINKTNTYSIFLNLAVKPGSRNEQQEMGGCDAWDWLSQLSLQCYSPTNSTLRRKSSGRPYPTWLKSR